ncbi:hypothetical protein LINPERHAP1_LOCUS13897 [Linum perenne]
MLLAAVGKDENNHVYLIAWIVIEGESRDGWMWFVSHLVEEFSSKMECDIRPAKGQ